MDEQLELFEAGMRNWRKRLWQAIPLETRQDVIHLLAQMGKEALQGDMKAKRRKESDNES